MLPPGTPLRIAVSPENFAAPDPIDTQMREVTPGVFVLNEQQQGAVLIAGTNVVAMPETPGWPSRPARIGEYISIFLTGLGQTTETLAPGAAAPLDRLIQARAPVSVVVGEAEVELVPSFVGLSPSAVSLFVINAQLRAEVPKGPSVPVYLKVKLSDGTVVRSNTVRIAIEDPPPSAGSEGQ
jgi:uncharacterized protein (TIGR03437 family)